MKFISNRRRFFILCLYVLALIFWLYLVIALKMYQGRAAFILWLTPIVFLISMYNIGDIDSDVEKDAGGTSFLEVGLVIAISLLSWMKDVEGFNPNLIYIMLLAMVFSLIGRIDVWVPSKWMRVYKHFKGIFQTFTLVLFCYVLLEFFFAGVSYHSLSKKREVEIK